MRYHSVRVLPGRSADRAPQASGTPRKPLVSVAHIAVGDGDEATGWPLVVTFSDGRELPSTLTDPTLLRDYLDYLGLSDDIVTYSEQTRKQLSGDDTPPAQNQLTLTT